MRQLPPVPVEGGSITSAQRKAAYYLRSDRDAGRDITAAGEDWLRAYDGAIGASRSRSRSKRVVHVEEEAEQEAAAVGTGPAAAAAAEAAVAGAVVREEGRRLDLLVNTALNAMARACDLHEKMAGSLLARSEQDARVQRRLLEAVRENFLARTEAEAEAAAAALEGEKADEDPIAAAVKDFMPAIAGMMMGGGTADKKPS